MYFTTMQICEVLGVESSWLRTLERTFKDIKPIINGSGKRRYRKLDFERIVWIYTQVEAGIDLKKIDINLHHISSSVYRKSLNANTKNKNFVAKQKNITVQSTQSKDLNEIRNQIHKRSQLIKVAGLILEKIRKKISI